MARAIAPGSFGNGTLIDTPSRHVFALTSCAVASSCFTRAAPPPFCSIVASASASRGSVGSARRASRHAMAISTAPLHTPSRESTLLPPKFATSGRSSAGSNASAGGGSSACAPRPGPSATGASAIATQSAAIHRRRRPRPMVTSEGGNLTSGASRAAARTAGVGRGGASRAAARLGLPGVSRTARARASVANGPTHSAPARLGSLTGMDRPVHPSNRSGCVAA